MGRTEQQVPKPETISSDEDVVFMPPNSLRAKVSVAEAEGPDFDRIEAGLAELGKEFVARLPGEIEAINQAFSAFSAMPQDEDAKKALFRRIHDLKGQGGTFKYDLITTIGNDLCRYIERPIAFTERRLAVVGFHIDAMSRVQRDAITGNGGALGERMVGTLRGMVKKVLDDVS